MPTVWTLIVSLITSLIILRLAEAKREKLVLDEQEEEDERRLKVSLDFETGIRLLMSGINKDIWAVSDERGYGFLYIMNIYYPEVRVRVHLSFLQDEPRIYVDYLHKRVSYNPTSDRKVRALKRDLTQYFAEANISYLAQRLKQNTPIVMAS